MTRPSDRYDFRWQRGHLAALIILCVVAAVFPTVRSLSGALQIGENLPTWPDRLSAGYLRINPNTASAARLQCLPGIGPAKADAIVAYRNAHGPHGFSAVEDLAAVRGIGAGIVGQVTPFVRFD